MVWFGFGRKISSENGQIWSNSTSAQHPYAKALEYTPRHRAPPRRRLLHLGGPEPGFFALSYMLRRSMLRLGEPLRLGIAKLLLGILASQVLIPLFH